MDKIIEKLKKNIVKSNNNKSSYWKKYLKEKTNFTNIYNPDIGVGKFKKKKYYFIHQFLLRLIYGNKIFKTETYKKFNSIFIKSGRMMDINSIRHVFTFEILKRYINPKKVCIIGDGGLNAVLGTHLTFPKAKIFSVNLSETLIHDYLILKNSKIIDIGSSTGTFLINLHKKHNKTKKGLKFEGYDAINKMIIYSNKKKTKAKKYKIYKKRY